MAMTAIRTMGGIAPRIFYFGGRYQISGVTQGVSGRRLVRLCDRQSGIPLKATWSNSTNGAYSFTGLANRDYIAYAVDYTNTYNCAVADRPPLTSM